MPVGKISHRHVLLFSAITYILIAFKNQDAAETRSVSTEKTTIAAVLQVSFNQPRFDSNRKSSHHITAAKLAITKSSVTPKSPHIINEKAIISGKSNAVNAKETLKINHIPAQGKRIIACLAMTKQ